MDHDIEFMNLKVYEHNEAGTPVSLFLIYFQHLRLIISSILSCCYSILPQVGGQLAFTLGLCLICRILHSALVFCYLRRGISDSTVQLLCHIGSTTSGILLLYYFYANSASVILGFSTGLGIWFLLIFVWLPRYVFNTRPLNPTLSLAILCLAVQLYCEFNMDRVQWHQLRGIIMLIVMKAISFSVDLCESPSSSRSGDLPGWRRVLPAWSAYCLCPASIIFGPWHSPGFRQELPQAPGHSPSGVSATVTWFKRLVCWLWNATAAMVTALFCLLWSTCILHMFTPDLQDFRWLEAYVASQSFRFSHYFVSYSSEAFVTTFAGFTATDSSTLVGGSSPLRVTHLWSVEWPRSLAEVVVSWSVPMHTWLKRYVYKPVRPYGQVWAILATYTASSLLHGVNFQLSAVLLSIGTFAYVEYILREKLASLLNACLKSRRCPNTCKHEYKSNRWGVSLANLCFTFLSIFQLAYLAVMFDTSEEQLQGYSMQHVLSKWAHLDFIGHYVALAILFLYLPISLLPDRI